MIAYKDQPDGRAYCYTFQFKGKEIALAGTVIVRKGATEQEIEAECHKHWRKIFPDNLDCPLVNFVPGALVFMSRKTP